jgi:hypothetical protein
MPLGSKSAADEGFLSGGSEVILQDQPLLHLMDAWICELKEQDFIESLPLLRRSLSGSMAYRGGVFWKRSSREGKRILHGSRIPRPKTIRHSSKRYRCCIRSLA